MSWVQKLAKISKTKNNYIYTQTCSRFSYNQKTQPLKL